MCCTILTISVPSRRLKGAKGENLYFQPPQGNPPVDDADDEEDQDEDAERSLLALILRRLRQIEELLN